MMKKCSLYLVLILLLFISTPVTVYADTDEDLFELYNKSSYGVLRTEIDSQISEVEEQIESVEQLKRKNEEYNMIVEEFNRAQSQTYKEVSSSVETYATQNNDIINNISDNILSMSVTELYNSDTTYKANTIIIDDLIESLNDIYFEDYYRETDFDLGSFYKEIEKLNGQYENAIDTTDIGDVNDIKWIMPNEYYVTSKFGYRLDPISKTRLSYHAGTDFRCAVGTEVGALFDGVVIDTGTYATAGNYVVVQTSDRIKYFYCHLSEVLVNKGDTVHQYDVIALSGSTGSRCTGPHLHVALYIDGSTVDVSKIFE